jgi:polysaccharide export outer membrane protein
MTMLRFSFLVVAGGLLSACAASPPPETISSSVAVPKLLPGEAITVQVFGQPQLSGQQMIDDDGNITMLLAGRIKVAGRTPEEVEADIRHRLGAGGIIVNPSVSVTVAQYLPVYVVGEVAKPGSFPWRNDMRVIDSVALAGGYTYRAQTNGLEVRRDNDPNRMPAAASEASRVQPGDVVVVPERWF